MVRKNLAVEPAVAAPHIIHARAVYSADEARRLLRLRASSIRRELREGRLRVSKRCGRYFLLGRWLLEWIEAGELPRRGMAAENGKPRKEPA
jgi:hypothetical protein